MAEAEVEDAVGVVVAEGVHVTTHRFGRTVDHAVTLGHAEGDVATEVSLLGRRLGIDTAVDGGRLVVFPDTLLLLRIAQLGRTTGDEGGEEYVYNKCIG